MDVKNNILFLLLCLFFNSVWGGDKITFHGSKIEIPDGYTQFSTEQLMVFRSTIFDREIMTVYEKTGKLSDLCRILFYYDSLSETKNLTFEKLVELKLEVIKESGIIFNDIVIDRDNHYAWGKSIILGDTSLFGFSIDENGIMGVQFNTSSNISNEDLKMFQKILKSITHQMPHQYIPEENIEVKKAKKEMKHSGMLMAISFVVMVLVWIIRKYLI